MINQNSEFLEWKQLTKGLLEKYPVGEINQAIENCIEELSNEEWFEQRWTKEDLITNEKVTAHIKVTRKKGLARKLIDERLNILQIPKLFGLQIKNNKIECPYHIDEDPSCLLNKETNTFYCFGCRAKGDIVELYRKLKEVIANGSKQTGV